MSSASASRKCGPPFAWCAKILATMSTAKRTCVFATPPGRSATSATQRCSSKPWISSRPGRSRGRSNRKHLRRFARRCSQIWQEVTRRVLDEDKAFAAVEEVATRALARLPDWRIEHDGWAALEPGLRRTYRTGHRALALATETSSVKNLHEWRKQAKYLWHQLQLLETAWTGSEKELDDQAHKLSQLLGDDHDLAVLRETLAADPLTYGGHRILKGVFAVIDRRREELEQQAFAIGRQLYKDSPRVFTSRIEPYRKAWAAEIEAATPPTSIRPAHGRKVVTGALT